MSAIEYIAAIVFYAWAGRWFVKHLQDRRLSLREHAAKSGRKTKNQIQEDRHDKRNKVGLVVYWIALGLISLPGLALVLFAKVNALPIATSVAGAAGIIARYGTIFGWMVIELRSKPEESIAGLNYMKDATHVAMPNSIPVGPEKGTGDEASAFSQDDLFAHENPTPRGYRQ